MTIVANRRFRSAQITASGVVPFTRGGLPVHLQPGNKFSEPTRTVVFAEDTPLKSMHVIGDALTGNIILQESNDGVNFVDAATATAVGTVITRNTQVKAIRVNADSITLATNLFVELNIGS